MQRSDFSSSGTRCAGTLYLPDTQLPAPIVVMGHGLGALQTFRLPAYAQRFVEQGLAVFTFDYRHWGESDGLPRQMLDPQMQLADWRAALAHVRGLDSVDGQRLGVWGSSFSGAHVVYLAAEDHDIRAVVAQVPAADNGRGASDTFSLGQLWNSVSAALGDRLAMLLGLEPRYISLVGKPGEAALMATPESWDGYLSLVPEGSDWENKITARSVLKIPGYRAVKPAHRVAAPTLLMAGRHDSLVHIDLVRTLAQEIPDASLLEFECDHFQPYYPPWFEEFVREQAAFLVNHLAVGQ